MCSTVCHSGFVICYYGHYSKLAIGDVVLWLRRYILSQKCGVWFLLTLIWMAGGKMKGILSKLFPCFKYGCTSCMGNWACQSSQMGMGGDVKRRLFCWSCLFCLWFVAFVFITNVSGLIVTAKHVTVKSKQIAAEIMAILQLFSEHCGWAQYQHCPFLKDIPNEQNKKWFGHVNPHHHHCHPSSPSAEIQSEFLFRLSICISYLLQLPLFKFFYSLL